MKISIAIFAALIVGSNAGLGLLGPVTNALDAASATSQANQLLNQLKSNISQDVSDGEDIINESLQEIAATLGELKNNLLTIALGLSNIEMEQIQNMVATLVDATELFEPVIINVVSQIGDIVSPRIFALSSNIFNGVVKLICFTNKVPKIRDIMNTLVSETRGRTKQFTNDVGQQLNASIDQLSELVDEFRACQDMECRRTVVSDDCCQCSITFSFLPGFQSRGTCQRN